MTELFCIHGGCKPVSVIRLSVCTLIEVLFRIFYGSQIFVFQEQYTRNVDIHSLNSWVRKVMRVIQSPFIQRYSSCIWLGYFIVIWKKPWFWWSIAAEFVGSGPTPRDMSQCDDHHSDMVRQASRWTSESYSTRQSLIYRYLNTGPRICHDI